MQVLMNEKENQGSKQKNEWAEIYGNMKNDIENLKKENHALNQHNDRLQKQVSLAGNASELNSIKQQQMALQGGSNAEH